MTEGSWSRTLRRARIWIFGLLLGIGVLLLAPSDGAVEFAFANDLRCVEGSRPISFQTSLSVLLADSYPSRPFLTGAVS